MYMQLKEEGWIKINSIPVAKGLLKVEILRNAADFDAHSLNAIFYSPTKPPPLGLFFLYIYTHTVYANIKMSLEL